MGETSVKLLEAHTHTQNLLDLINEFSNIAEYKINIQKSIVFLYTYNEQSDNEIYKTIQFILASKRIRHFRINLTKKVQNLYSENYKKKKKLKETSEDLNKWKDTPCSRTRRQYC